MKFKPILDLDLERSMQSRSLDGLSGILHGGQLVCPWGSLFLQAELILQAISLPTRAPYVDSL